MIAALMSGGSDVRPNRSAMGQSIHGDTGLYAHTDRRCETPAGAPFPLYVKISPAMGAQHDRSFPMNLEVVHVVHTTFSLGSSWLGARPRN